MVSRIMPDTAVPFCVMVNDCPLPDHVPVNVWLTGAGIGSGAVEIAVGAAVDEGAVGEPSLQAAARPAVIRTAIRSDRVMPY
jgi:hypothetical protein